MNSDCRRLLGTLLEGGGGADDSELRAHLEGCAECRHLLATWQALREVPLPVTRTHPPESVDLAIRREAMVFIEERSRRHHAMTRWVSWVAAAACVALVAGMAVSLFNEGSEPAPVRPAVAPPWAPGEAEAATAWSQVGLDGDLFVINAELEITYAILMQDLPRRSAAPLPRRVKPGKRET